MQVPCVFVSSPALPRQQLDEQRETDNHRTIGALKGRSDGEERVDIRELVLRLVEQVSANRVS